GGSAARGIRRRARSARSRHAALHLGARRVPASLPHVVCRAALRTGLLRRVLRAAAAGPAAFGVDDVAPPARGNGDRRPRRSVPAERRRPAARRAHRGRARLGGSAAAPAGHRRALRGRARVRCARRRRDGASSCVFARLVRVGGRRGRRRRAMNERSFTHEERERMFSMDPPFTPEHQLFRRTLREYVERELTPHALEWDEAGIFPREVFRGMAEIGALGINYPESVGGAGGDYWFVVVLAEELIRSQNAGVSLVTFPTDVKGFSVSKKLAKVGNLSSDTALLFFEDCRIPVRYLLGEENEGFYHVMTNFQGERLVAAIGAVSGMQLLVEDALRYGNERSAFGKPLAKFQVWRHRLVEHLTAIEAARWLTYRACDLYNRKEAAVKEISMAKLFAGDLIQKVVYDCQQLHGGMGYVVETPVARAFRDARLLTIGGGTSEIMKEIIAKLVPGF